MALAPKSTALIVITMGDPAGIGPEVILKSAAELEKRRHAPSIVVIGDLDALVQTARRLKDVPEPCEVHPGDAPEPLSKGLGVLTIGKLSRAACRPAAPRLKAAMRRFSTSGAGDGAAR